MLPLCRATVLQSFATFWMNVQSSAITASSPDGEGGKNVTVRGLHVVLLQPHNSSGMSTVELV